MATAAAKRALLKQLLEPTMRQVATLAYTPEELLPWEASLIRGTPGVGGAPAASEGINPDTFLAIIHYWELKKANNPAIITPNSFVQNLLFTHTTNDDRAKWLTTTGAAWLVDVGVLQEATQYLLRRDLTTLAPAEVTTADKVLDLYQDWLGGGRLELGVDDAMSGAMRDLTQKGTVVDARLADETTALRPVLEVLQAQKTGSSTTPVTPITPVPAVLLGATTALRDAGVTQDSMPALEGPWIEAPAHLAMTSEGTLALEPGVTVHHHALTRSEEASQLLYFLLPTLRALREQISGSAAPSYGRNWLAAVEEDRRMHLLRTTGISDTLDGALQEVREAVGGSGEVAAVMRAQDSAFRNVALWPLSMLSALSERRLRRLVAAVNQWRVRVLQSADRTLQTLGWTGPAASASAVRDLRLALIEPLWNDHLTPLVRSLLSEMGRRLNVLQVPLSGDDRAFFTHRYLDLAFRYTHRAQTPMRAEEMDEMNLLHKIVYPLHTAATFKAEVDAWRAIRMRSAVDAEVDNFVDATLASESAGLDVAPSEAETGVVRDLDSKIAGALTEVLDAQLAARTGDSASLLEEFYAALYAAEALSFVDDVGKRAGATVASVQVAASDAGVRLIRAIGSLFALPVAPAALDDFLVKRANGVRARVDPTIQAELDAAEAAGGVRTATVAAVAKTVGGLRADALLAPITTKAAGVNVIQTGRSGVSLTLPAGSALTTPPLLAETVARDQKMYVAKPASPEKALEELSFVLRVELLNSVAPTKEPPVYIMRRDVLEYELRRLLRLIEPDQGERYRPTSLYLDALDTSLQQVGRVVARLPPLTPLVERVEATLTQRHGTEAWQDLAVTQSLRVSQNPNGLVFALPIPPVSSWRARGSMQFGIKLTYHFADTLVAKRTLEPSAAAKVIFVRPCGRCNTLYDESDNNGLVCRWSAKPVLELEARKHMTIDTEPRACDLEYIVHHWLHHRKPLTPEQMTGRREELLLVVRSHLAGSPLHLASAREAEEYIALHDTRLTSGRYTPTKEWDPMAWAAEREYQLRMTTGHDAARAIDALPYDYLLDSMEAHFTHMRKSPFKHTALQAIRELRETYLAQRLERRRNPAGSKGYYQQVPLVAAKLQQKLVVEQKQEADRANLAAKQAVEHRPFHYVGTHGLTTYPDALRLQLNEAAARKKPPKDTRKLRAGALLPEVPSLRMDVDKELEKLHEELKEELLQLVRLGDTATDVQWNHFREHLSRFNRLQSGEE